MNYLILILVAVCVLILAWNFYPPFRERMKGYSTIAEGVIGTLMYYFGMFSEALDEAQAQGYIPDNWVQYVPFIMLTWIVVKRLQTTTPVGEK